MSSFASQHRKWQQAEEDADASGSKAAREEAERQRQALIASRAVQQARRQTNARPVR